MTTEQVRQAIVAAAERYGVAPSLALAVARAESGYRTDAVSPVGAVGVMQLMPATAADLGVNPHDPLQNIDGGVRYLAQMLRLFGGDVRSALAAYNFGPGNVSRGVAWPAETRAYVARVTEWAGAAPAGASAAVLAAAAVGVAAAVSLLF